MEEYTFLKSLFEMISDTDKEKRTFAKYLLECQKKSAQSDIIFYRSVKRVNVNLLDTIKEHELFIQDLHRIEQSGVKLANEGLDINKINETSNFDAGKITSRESLHCNFELSEKIDKKIAESMEVISLIDKYL